MIKLPVEKFANRIGVESMSETELFEALARLPKLSSDGPWLAGGALRKTVLRQPLDSDFDFFFKDEAQLNAFVAELKNLGATKTVSNDKNQTFILPSCFVVKDNPLPGVEAGSPLFVLLAENDKDKEYLPELKLQLINFQYYENLEAVLESFDFSLCQFGFDGENIVMSEFALWDTASKKLVPSKITFGVASLRRLIKYTSQGFTICGGGLGEILNQVVANPEIIQQETLYID